MMTVSRASSPSSTGGAAGSMRSGCTVRPGGCPPGLEVASARPGSIFRYRTELARYPAHQRTLALSGVWSRPAATLTAITVSCSGAFFGVGFGVLSIWGRDLPVGMQFEQSFLREPADRER